MSERALERSCQLLGLDPGNLRRTLLNRSLQAGGSRRSIFVKPVGIAEARSRRDCLAMLLYSRYQLCNSSSVCRICGSGYYSRITDLVIIIIMYVYHALINTLSTHMIHINLNKIFYSIHKHLNMIYIIRVEPIF